MLGPARFTAPRISALVGRLERNSRDLHIPVVGGAEQDGVDCLLIIRNYLTLVGFEDDLGENAHRTGRKREEKTRNIIVNFHSRPFKRVLLRVAKNQENKQELNEVRFVEDFTPYDFEIRKKALPIMKQAFDQGKKVRFTRGKLFIDSKAVPVEQLFNSCSIRRKTMAMFFAVNTK